MKQTRRYSFLLFHSYNPKQKRNHQMASGRAKARSTQSQSCVKYRGINILINRNTIVNTSDLKIFHKKMSKKGWFSRHYLQFLRNFISFEFNFMHYCRAVINTVNLAPRYKGHSLSVQCYNFYLHAILFR